MKFYIGVTDDTWFHFLARHRPDEVNFWRPGGKTNFRVTEVGAPFLLDYLQISSAIRQTGGFPH